MTAKEKRVLTVINGKELPKVIEKKKEHNESSNIHSNPMYEKLLNFRNLQEAQKKKFSVDDLFRLC